MTAVTKPTSWKEDKRLKRHGWAPGSYLCKCAECSDLFIGDKRAVTCADCAYKEPDAPAMPVAPLSHDELCRRAHSIIARPTLHQLSDAVKLLGLMRDALSGAARPRSIALMEAEVARLEAHNQTLLETNNAYLERARVAERKLEAEAAEKAVASLSR